MNVRALLRPVRRLWPQKVRTRLTLIYAMLFFAAGSALLGLTYGLVASSLPARPAAAPTVSSQELANLKHECTRGERRGKGQAPGPHPEVASDRVQACGERLQAPAPPRAPRRSARAR